MRIWYSVSTELSYTESMSLALRGFALLVGLGLMSRFALADLIIDDFDQGTFSRVFKAPGNYSGIFDSLDATHTAGGSRQYLYSISSNPSNSDVTIGVNGGSFRASWAGIVTQTLNLEYGAGEPMLLNLSWLTSFEIARTSNPDGINAVNYAMFLRDSSGNDDSSFSPRQRANQGIGFNRVDFLNPLLDWSKITFIGLRQSYTNNNTLLRGYTTDEISAVPEMHTPTALLLGAVLFWWPRKRVATRFRVIGTER